MTTVTIHKQIDSETLHLPELKPFIGKRVEIVVREEEPAVLPPGVDPRWQPLANIGGKDLIDPDVVNQYREFDRQHNIAPDL